jgi:DNA-binding response OmpR family regulator
MAAPQLLVIDDSPTIRKLVEIAFRSSGLVLDFSPTGKSGIERARQTPPDAILLDYVLPDMRGVDVCEQLSRRRETAGVPVLLMTAKGEGIRDLFHRFDNVVDFVAKPFSADDIVGRVRKAVAASGRARDVSSTRTRTHFSLQQQEAAARAIFSRLRGAFARIPAWSAQLGSLPPAQFFARKILTPDLMNELLDALLPVYREIVDGAALRDAGHPEGEATLRGELTAWPLADLITLFSASGRTGELQLMHGSRSTLAYFRRGEIVLVTSRELRVPEGFDLDLSRVSTTAMRNAEAAQRADGKPLSVSLAEAGELPPCDLVEILRREGKRLLTEVVSAGPASFAFRETMLPAYVEAYGRHVSLGRETLVFGAPGGSSGSASLEQLTLERLRRTDPGEYASDEVPSLARVYDRPRGFSQKVRGFDLSAAERRLLTLVDGRASLRELVAHSNLEARETQLTALRLAEVGLLAELTEGWEDPDARSAAARSVMILEPDVEGFRQPLESLLRGRGQPLTLVSLDATTDVLGAIMRERPRLVILNASAGGEGIGDTARAVRALGELADVSLVAVLEAHSASEAEKLAAAGFDAVLTKPVAFAELERLIP